jgi:hypothetical protein
MAAVEKRATRGKTGNKMNDDFEDEIEKEEDWHRIEQLDISEISLTKDGGHKFRVLKSKELCDTEERALDAVRKAQADLSSELDALRYNLPPELAALTTLAKERVAKSGETYEAAYSEAVLEHPELYTALVKRRREQL